MCRPARPHPPQPDRGGAGGGAGGRAGGGAGGGGGDARGAAPAGARQEGHLRGQRERGEGW